MITVTAPDAETRRPIGWANYLADVTADIATKIASGRPMGPNYMGEQMWPVEATFDPETARTRVGFSLMPPTFDLGGGAP